MPWQNLSVFANSEAAERLEALLLSKGAISVTMVDAGDNPVLEPAPGTTPLWNEVKLSALFPMQTNLDDLQYILRSHCDRYDVNTLADQDWERAWLKDFKPVCFGEKLWIRPTGFEVPANALSITMDPGLAFGTGSHATTALCLEWLASNDILGSNTLDYGCGSGILAIAAKAVGASAVTATDIDPQAILACQLNALRNDIDRDFWVCEPDQIEDRFDLLMANILYQPLIELCSTFAHLLIPGGRIILSGILLDQADMVIDAYAEHFHWDVPQTRDEWVLLVGRRHSN